MPSYPCGVLLTAACSSGPSLHAGGTPRGFGRLPGEAPRRSTCLEIEGAAAQEGQGRAAVLWQHPGLGLVGPGECRCSETQGAGQAPRPPLGTQAEDRMGGCRRYRPTKKGMNERADLHDVSKDMHC